MLAWICGRRICFISIFCLKSGVTQILHSTTAVWSVQISKCIYLQSIYSRWSKTRRRRKFNSLVSYNIIKDILVWDCRRRFISTIIFQIFPTRVLQAYRESMNELESEGWLETIEGLLYWESNNHFYLTEIFNSILKY